MAIGANSFSENFNSLSQGNINGQGSYAHASAWSTTGTGAACSVTVFGSGELSPRMLLADDETGQKAVASLSLDSGYRPVAGYIQFDYLHPGGGFSSYVLLQSSSSEGDSICGIGFDDASFEIRAWDGSSWTRLQSWSALIFYTVKIIFDTIAGTALFYVNGVLKATRSLLNSTDAVTHVYFRTVTADDGSFAHFDNLVFAGDARVDPSDTIAATISMTPVATHSAEYTYTASVTISMSPQAFDSKTLKTDYGYYLGTDNGTIHQYSDEFKGDAGVIIPCQYVTKDTDFSEQDQASNDRWKTVYGVKLFYEDMYASTNIVVAISTDGGATWPYNQSQTLGTGSETRKDAMFWFMVTGQFFRFRASSGSASTTFKLLGMEIEYQDSGEHWSIA